MTRLNASPHYRIQPRGLTRAETADHIAVSSSNFCKLVADGQTLVENSAYASPALDAVSCAVNGNRLALSLSGRLRFLASIYFLDIWLAGDGFTIIAQFIAGSLPSTASRIGQPEGIE